jgi:hypothetical protein
MSAEAPTTAEKREAHLRGVKVTTLNCMFGIAAAVVSWAVTSGVVAQLPERAGLGVLVLAIAFQKPLLPRLGKEEMSTKDWAYVSFMTLCLWFVTWTILLTA